MTAGQYNSRFTGNKVTKHKKATPIGKWVILDQERCILCARCVRFTNEISKTDEMAIYNRGDHCEIDTYPGRGLGNRYSANIVDICPVGALTCRDYRFQCRVWYLKSAPSVCPGCSQGCNIDIHYNLDRPQKKIGHRVMRLKPRYNPEVNDYWICDDGRYNYGFIDANRIRYSTIGSSRSQKQVYLRDALDHLADLVRKTISNKTLYLLSAHSSNEELFAARKLFQEELKCACVFPDTDVHTGDKDDFLIQEDKHPNTKGVKEIFSIQDKAFISTDSLAKTIEDRSIRLLLVNRHELPEETLSRIRERGCRIVYFGTNETMTAQWASLTIPVAVYAEKEGTFTNFQGRIQQFSLAVPSSGESLPEWAIYDRLAKLLDLELEFDSTTSVFNQLSREIPFFKNLQFQDLGPNGVLGPHE